ncbi:hypothetical protein [Nitratiruptor sp. YY09-18]|uniref:hypothetical protein n=1 Tax=Nitratiruptor sp. YY09-18 TaxID=2724901 RepID=UPI0019160ABB|nr:hypothetical protein [Nitratiruptor sp. YY09-18]BCD68910.1 hypothetical protein NitYY0918_C1829 [Nitratiruptor sp. YY09-18]
MQKLFFLATITFSLLQASTNLIDQKYGSLSLRLRSHYIHWDWKKETAKRVDNWAMGFGGSLQYQSPSWNNFYTHIGYYFSRNPWHMKRSKIAFVKSGKDMFCRYKVAKGEGFNIDVLAEAYIGYKTKNSDVQIGRFLFDSIFIKPNDSKMIPNAFEGISYEWKDEKSRLKFGYLTKQKLRDKTFFHDVITFGKDLDSDGQISGYEKWRENDDAGSNHALSWVNLKKAHKDTDNKIIVAEYTTKCDPLVLVINTTVVPDLFGLFAVEPKYTKKYGQWRVFASARVVLQRDLGAKDIGKLGIAVANLKGEGDGYKDPYNVDGGLYMAKVGATKDAWSMQLAYSHALDKADIIDPWRGFPTGGYTRAMAQYNWYANTSTWMLQAKYDLQAIVPKLQTMIRVSLQDFDDKKRGVQADANTFEIDFLKRFAAYPGLYVKLRLGHTVGESDTKDITGQIKPDPSFDELRFEISYIL